MYRNLYRNLLIGFLFLVSFIWFAYIGRYKTLYGAGILVTPVVIVLALLPFFASAFLFNKSWAYSARVFLISCTIMFIGMVCGYYISEYKPTLYVNVPADYEGCIFLFHEEGKEVVDVTIDEHGIAYIPWGGHYYLNVRYAGKKRPEILNTSHSNQIQFYNADSSKVHYLDVNCMELGPEVDYSKQEFIYRGFYPCMEGRELRSLIAKGIIDSSRIRWIFYDYNTHTSYDPI